ncbi:MAG: hypothetical protein ACK5PF_04535, partial [bacterium]
MEISVKQTAAKARCFKHTRITIDVRNNIFRGKRTLHYSPTSYGEDAASPEQQEQETQDSPPKNKPKHNGEGSRIRLVDPNVQQSKAPVETTQEGKTIPHSYMEHDHAKPDTTNTQPPPCLYSPYHDTEEYHAMLNNIVQVFEICYKQGVHFFTEDTYAYMYALKTGLAPLTPTTSVQPVGNRQITISGLPTDKFYFSAQGIISDITKGYTREEAQQAILENINQLIPGAITDLTAHQAHGNKDTPLTHTFRITMSEDLVKTTALYIILSKL